MAYTAAVITVSDKGSRGERIDTSGPMLVDMLKERGYEVVYTKIVPDDREEIKSELINCADGLNVALILTTGGTGFARRDITPEATMEVIDRETPGIPELMRAESAKITNRACLSRSKAGIRKSTLIINLPGSEKAAKENFEAVADALDHGMEMLLSAGSANCAEEPENVFSKKSSGRQDTPVKKGVISKLFHSKAYEQPEGPGEQQLFFNLKEDEAFNSAAYRQSQPDAVPELMEGASEAGLYDGAADDPAAYGTENELDEFTNDLTGMFAKQEKTDTFTDDLAGMFAKKEYIPVPEDAFAQTQILNGKRIPPRIDLWLREAKQSEYAPKCGMYLTHNGTVREDAKEKVRQGNDYTQPVTGMKFSYNEKGVREAIEHAYQMPGIYYIKVWLNEGDLDVGDDIMFVLIGGDIRPRVINCLQELVGTIKSKCVEEAELY